ncbi:MAG: hypothetical protein WCP91_00030 [Candidatus Berkelbacteria bacterium]
MTLEEVDKILPIYGKYVEYAEGILMYIFSTKIPESFLPFPKDILYEAFHIAIEHHQKLGDKRMVRIYQEQSVVVTGFYVNDDEALSRAAKDFNDPKRCEFLLSSWKDRQKNWIKTQDIQLNMTQPKEGKCVSSLSEEAWQDAVKKVGEMEPRLTLLLQNCKADIIGKEIILKMKYKFHYDRLLFCKAPELLEVAIKELTGDNYTISCKIDSLK